MGDSSVILVVDDSKTSLTYLESILKKNGYQTALSDSGEDALRRVAEVKPDLILLDVIMSGLDGYEVCRQIKGNCKLGYIPIIFLSSKNSSEDIVMGFKAGGVDYVTKPFNNAELLARIETHLELKRAREEIKALRGLIPICANCKKIKNSEGYWEQVESYLQRHTDANFSHGLCAECYDQLYGDFI